MATWKNNMVKSPEQWNFEHNWSYSGEATYNPQTNKWSVTGNVYLKTWSEGGQIPGEFDQIGGYLDIGASNVTTLYGCPEKVDELLASGNPLTSLEFAPRQCREINVKDCPLVTLVHLPPLEHLILTWIPTLPMLRCLTAQKVTVTTHSDSKTKMAQVINQVLNDPQWMGKGKLGMLNCALALKKAGEQFVDQYGTNPFLENARW